jgi:hypothetical protein
MCFVSSTARLFVIGKISRIAAMKMLTQQAANVRNEAKAPIGGLTDYGEILI